MSLPPIFQLMVEKRLVVSRVFLQRYVQMAHKIHIIINVQNHVYMRILQIYKGFYISHMCMNTRIRMICRIHHF